MKLFSLLVLACIILTGCPKDEPKTQEPYDPTNGTDTPPYNEDTTFRMPPAGVPETYIWRP